MGNLSNLAASNLIRILAHVMYYWTEKNNVCVCMFMCVREYGLVVAYWFKFYRNTLNI